MGVFEEYLGGSSLSLSVKKFIWARIPINGRLRIIYGIALWEPFFILWSTSCSIGAEQITHFLSSFSPSWSIFAFFGASFSDFGATLTGLERLSPV
ncbi:hypothetical protein [Bacillus oleivorans]|uniref:hypothetical protein n=1 Tax=Bacillus oleivorans TaxID=1448271 RepID=UPI00115592D1|nr:hypothetical protein [Bacillus oleivorans]